MARLRSPCRQNCAEIAQLFINVLRFLDGSRDLLAHQHTISLPQLVEKALHSSFRDAEGVGELQIRNILPLRSQIISQRRKYASSPTRFTLFSQASQRMFDCRSGPVHVENLFRKPSLSFL